MYVRLIVPLLLLLPAFAFAGDTKLREIWASREYTSAPVPAEWIPPVAAVPEKSLSAFENYSTGDGFVISNFIARFGIPSRYLVARRRNDHDFLIYDLPSGHAVALYAAKPPGKNFAAIAIIDSAGTLVKLIK
jgi:hypothetical protein